MRAELDRSDAAAFDLKQGEGGLVDLEFLLQTLVLQGAHGDELLLSPRNTPGLIAAAHTVSLIDEGTTAASHRAHALMLARGLDCTLDRRPRRVPYYADIDAARGAIRAAAQARGLYFAGVGTEPA